MTLNDTPFRHGRVSAPTLIPHSDGSSEGTISGRWTRIRRLQGAVCGAMEPPPWRVEKNEKENGVSTCAVSTGYSMEQDQALLRTPLPKNGAISLNSHPASYHHQLHGCSLNFCSTDPAFVACLLRPTFPSENSCIAFIVAYSVALRSRESPPVSFRQFWSAGHR